MNQGRKRDSIKNAFLSGLTNLLVIMCSIVFFFIIYKFSEIISLIRRLCGILAPLILGVAFAYLVNPVMMFFEEQLERIYQKAKNETPKKKRFFRLPAIILTFITVGGVLYLLGSMAVPEIYANITRIIYAAPSQMTKYYKMLIGMMSDNSWLSEFVNQIYTSIMDFLTGWMKNEMFSQISVIINGVMGVVGAVSNLLIGCIVAIYVLSGKEYFARQFNIVLRAFFPDEVSLKIKEIIRESDRIFGGFISGKLMDSFIIGILYFIGAIILRLPYAVLISVIIGVTNVIPFFGPYIGAVPSALLIFLESPAKGLIFIIFILLLQQFDGNILGPKILGDSIGLSPFWVIFSIVLGGGFFGIIGMLIGVPTFGVIYYLVKRYIYYRLNKKEAIRIEEKEEITAESQEEG